MVFSLLLLNVQRRGRGGGVSQALDTVRRLSDVFFNVALNRFKLSDNHKYICHVQSFWSSKGIKTVHGGNGIENLCEFMLLYFSQKPGMDKP